MDKNNDTYECHPESSIKYYGYKIYKWEDLLNLIKELHTFYFPKIKYISWDMALNDEGKWVVVEYGWGQLSAQIANDVGLKSIFHSLLKGKPISDFKDDCVFSY